MPRRKTTVNCLYCARTKIKSWGLCELHYRRWRNKLPMEMPLWSNDGCVDHKGYIRKRRGGKPIREHRYVVEQALGRKLNADEDIHHINGNKQDNRLCNLEIINHRAHALYHFKKYWREWRAKRENV